MSERKQTILVTGSTSGIGRHAAIWLAKRSHRVFATGRNEKALAALKSSPEGAALETVQLDVTDAASIARARATVAARTDGRGIDVLVNNAGFGVLGFRRRNITRALPAAALLAALVGTALVPATARAEPPKSDVTWERIKDSDGILVERRVVAGSPLREFRGSATVNAPIATILAVFSDVPRATEWMDSCNGSHTVVDSGDTDKVVYNRTHAPWPVADRDAVLHNVARIDEAERRIELDFWTVTDEKEPPVKGVVRMPFLRGHWILWPSTDGATTRVEYQVHANPGGALPNWLVNYVSRDLPYKTIEGLRAQVKRRHYPEFESHIKEHFGRYPFLWPRS